MKSNNNNLSFKIYGVGHPVILIPGFASKANSWGLQYRWLKKYFKVIAIENSVGMTGKNETGCEIEKIASDINTILKSLSIAKTAVLGSSMGAMIGLEFAQKYPAKVSSLILSSFPIESTSFLKDFTEDFNDEIQFSNSESFFKKTLPVFFSPDFIKKDRFRIFTDFFIQNGTSFSKDVLHAQLQAIRAWRESDRWMEGCKCPCLFIYGSEDQFVSKENTIDKLIKVFSESEVKIIQGAGHAVHIEKHREFNNIVHIFLDKHH